MLAFFLSLLITASAKEKQLEWFDQIDLLTSSEPSPKKVFDQLRSNPKLPNLINQSLKEKKHIPQALAAVRLLIVDSAWDETFKYVREVPSWQGIEALSRLDESHPRKQWADYLEGQIANNWSNISSMNQLAIAAATVRKNLLIKTQQLAVLLSDPIYEIQREGFKLLKLAIDKRKSKDDLDLYSKTLFMQPFQLRLAAFSNLKSHPELVKAFKADLELCAKNEAVTEVKKVCLDLKSSS